MRIHQLTRQQGGPRTNNPEDHDRVSVWRVKSPHAAIQTRGNRDLMLKSRPLPQHTHSYSSFAPARSLSHRLRCPSRSRVHSRRPPGGSVPEALSAELCLHFTGGTSSTTRSALPASAAPWPRSCKQPWRHCSAPAGGCLDLGRRLLGLGSRRRLAAALALPRLLPPSWPRRQMPCRQPPSPWPPVAAFFARRRAACRRPLPLLALPRRPSSSAAPALSADALALASALRCLRLCRICCLGLGPAAAAFCFAAVSALALAAAAAFSFASPWRRRLSPVLLFRRRRGRRGLGRGL